MNFRLSEPNHSSSVRFSSSPPGDEPAHVTSTSIWPKRSIVPLTATLHPSSTSSSAVARPMPRLAPVMKTTWSFSPRSTLSPLSPVSVRHPRKRVAAHLAHPVDGQLVERDDPLRALVRRQPLAGVRDERLAVEVAGRHDEGDDLLAPALGRHARHRHLLDRRVVLERRLDLARVDVQP